MALVETAIRRINYAERLTSSVNGNPRFRVHFMDTSSAVTSSDAAVSYHVDNLCRLGTAKVEVTFTRAGRISDMKLVHPLD